MMSETDKLCNELRFADGMVDQALKQQADIDRLKGELEESQRYITALRLERDGAVSIEDNTFKRCNALQQQLSEARAAYGGLEGACNAAHRVQKNLERQLTESNGTCKVLRADLALEQAAVCTYLNRISCLERQLAEARAEVQFYKEAQAYAENQYLLAIQETNLLRGNIKEANSQIEALTDCLNGSRKATYTAEMYDKGVAEARKDGWEQAKMEAADQCSNLIAHTLAESDMRLGCCCAIDAMSYKEAT